MSWTPEMIKPSCSQSQNCTWCSWVKHHFTDFTFKGRFERRLIFLPSSAHISAGVEALRKDKLQNEQRLQQHNKYQRKYDLMGGWNTQVSSPSSLFLCSVCSLFKSDLWPSKVTFCQMRFKMSEITEKCRSSAVLPLNVKRKNFFFLIINVPVNITNNFGMKINTVLKMCSEGKHGPVLAMCT